MYKLILSLCALAVVSAVVQPSSPVWPNQWQSDFNEMAKTPIIGSGNTTGTFYYDYTNSVYRIDRKNGRADRYCGSVKLHKDTPCTHLVVDDMRYLYYPELNYCCACCTSADGCGLVTPNWLNNATYVGQTTLDGVTVDEWSIKGLQQNLYYELPSSRTPVLIDMQPNDYIYYNTSTFQAKIVDPSVFNLPAGCSPKTKCSKLSVCGVARMQGAAKRALGL